ncbi:ATP-binding protein [Methanoculleus sp. 10]
MKRLEDFDMSFQPSLDPAAIRDLASLQYIHHARNVVFLLYSRNS